MNWNISPPFQFLCFGLHLYEELYVIGAGGLGLEIAASLSHPFFNEKYTLRGFIDDKYPPAEVINGIPVQGGIDLLLEQKKPNAVIAIANPINVILYWKIFQVLDINEK